MKNLFSALIAIFVFGASALAQEISPCPTLSIEQPDLTKPDELMPFKVEIKNGSSNLGYKWTVSAGTIAEGQGTPVIKVATTREMDNQTVTATVEIIGLPKNCLNVASQTGGVSNGNIDPTPIEEYERISFQDEKARLDIVARELKNYKDWKAVFLIYYKKTDTIQAIKNRVSKISKILTELFNIPGNELSFVFNESDSSYTTIYISPTEAGFDGLSLEQLTEKLKSQKQIQKKIKAQ